jgi:hypothetical protein
MNASGHRQQLRARLRAWYDWAGSNLSRFAQRFDIRLTLPRRLAFETGAVTLGAMDSYRPLP